MKKVYIVYKQFFDYNGQTIQIGGVETYLYALSQVLLKESIKPIIYQFATHDFKKNYDGIDVIGIRCSIDKFKRSIKTITKHITKEFDKDNDYLLFAAEHYVIPFKYKEKVLAIQHGIHWDIPNHKPYLVNLLKSFIRSIVEYKRVNNCNKLICVDYNYVNWYRATFKKFDYNKIFVIPNFYYDNNEEYRLDYLDDNSIRIVFARRFVEYRGVKIFAHTAKKLLERYGKKVNIVFAGDGPEKQMLESMFAIDQNVFITKYNQNISLPFHKNFDIAVVPTVGSEGTSLSLLDAMAAGCAVITTNVGGLTNIVIDHFNGLIVNADEKNFYKSLELLIEDQNLRNKLSENALLTVKSGFSHDDWSKRWLKMFEE